MKKNVTKLEEAILETRRKIAESNQRKREEKATEKEKLKLSARPKGRPKLDAGLIKRAKKLAQTKPLSEVALILDVAVSSLYNNGISRKLIKEEKEEKADPFKILKELKEEILAKNEKDRRNSKA